MEKKSVGIVVLLLTFWMYLNFSIAATEPDRREIEGNTVQNIKVPILLYHNIMDNYDVDQNAVHIGIDEFETHMCTLSRAGYHTITFTEYYNYIVNGAPLPENPIIITFDDGYSSNYEYAYPILKKYNMKATIFVITGRMGAIDDVTYPHFTWEQAREMQASGTIDIQSHSDFHPDLTREDIGRVQLELRRSRYLIQKELKKSCDVFAYPYGLYNAEMQKMVEAAGYKMHVLVGDKGVNAREDGPKQLKRLTVFGGTSADRLLYMLEKNMNSDQ